MYNNILRNYASTFYRFQEWPQSQDFPKTAQIDPFLDVITYVLDI